MDKCSCGILCEKGKDWCSDCLTGMEEHEQYLKEKQEQEERCK